MNLRKSVILAATAAVCISPLLDVAARCQEPTRDKPAARPQRPDDKPDPVFQAAKKFLLENKIATEQRIARAVQQQGTAAVVRKARSSGWIGLDGAVAAEPRRDSLIQREIVEPPPADWGESMAKKFSLVKTAEYLDAAALHWTKTRNCATCHTNIPHMMARPLLSKLVEDSGEVRQAFEHWSENLDTSDGGLTSSTLSVVLAASLAINDHQSGDQLHSVTRKALDRMWLGQRDDGGWNVRKADAPPMKSDDHWAVTFATVAVGLAPDGYQQTPQAQAGLRRVRQFLQANPPHSLHHRAMVAWASLLVEGLMSDPQRRDVIDEMLALQLKDGGWSAASLFADWPGWDLEESDFQSDGYGTGFVIYLARLSGVPIADQRLQRGVRWIKKNQRESGRWFTPSFGPDNPYGDNRIATAGTAMIVMALDACGEIQQHDVQLETSP